MPVEVRSNSLAAKYHQRAFFAAIHSSRRFGNLLLMAPFLCFYYVQLAHHVLWRDEMNAWAIAYISPTISELLRRVHYEGHPALWYLILYAASRMTHATWMLKVVEGVIGTAIYLLLALTTPFRRLELLLIFLGYYISFEYTVLCRMYSLEVLCALIYVWFRMHHPDWMVRNVLWLGVIANLDVTAGILSAGLMLEYLVERYGCYKKTGAPRLRQFVAGAAVYVFCVVIAIATLWPAKDMGWSCTGKMFAYFWSAEHLGCSFARWASMAWFPQLASPMQLWGDDTLFWPYGFIIPIVLAMFYIIFRTHRRLGVMLFSIFVLGVSFSQTMNVAGIRHIGILYIGFLIALWIIRYQAKPVSVLTYIFLGLTVVATGNNIVKQWGRPFTDDDAAARWIRQQHLEDMPLLGTPDTHVIGVPERLNRPIYQLACNCVDSVLTFSRRRDSFNPAIDVPPRIIQGMKTLGVPSALLLINRPLDAGEQRELFKERLRVGLAAKFDQGMLEDEHFYIYRVTSEAAIADIVPPPNGVGLTQLSANFSKRIDSARP